jgi:hypothetical protein
VLVVDENTGSVLANLEAVLCAATELAMAPLEALARQSLARLG